MPAPRLTFWYEFASSYSYLSAMRIDAAAQAAGVEVVWQPFLLGPIFKAQGWTSSPFSLYPAKGRYIGEGHCAHRGLARDRVSLAGAVPRQHAEGRAASTHRHE